MISTGESIVLLLIYQLVLTLLAIMRFMVDSSKKDYIKYLDFIETNKGIKYRKFYLICDVLDYVGCFWFIGCFPTIFILMYIFK